MVLSIAGHGFRMTSLPPSLGPISLPSSSTTAASIPKRKGSRSRFKRRGARQRSDHVHAGFGLPPGINDRAALATNVFVIPHPRFGIDRLANRAKQAKGRQVVFRRPLISPFHESANGGWRGVENCHAIAGDDAPEAVWLRPIGRALMHERGRAVGEGCRRRRNYGQSPSRRQQYTERVLLAEIEDVAGVTLTPSKYPPVV